MAGKATLVTSHATRLIHLSIRLPGNHGVASPNSLQPVCLIHESAITFALAVMYWNS
jgi:hypothetical protein